MIKKKVEGNEWLMDKHINAEGNEWLTDKHINAVNNLLSHRFPSQIGLMSLYEYKKYESISDNFVQITNIISCKHWVCVIDVQRQKLMVSMTVLCSLWLFPPNYVGIKILGLKFIYSHLFVAILLTAVKQMTSHLYFII